MGITFAVRSTQVDARYALSGKHGAMYGETPNAGTIVNDPSALGGQFFDLGITDQARNNNVVLYNGQKNWPTGQTFSVLMRLYFNNISSPKKCLFVGSRFGEFICPLFMSYNPNHGGWSLVATDDTTSDGPSDNQIISGAPPTGQWTDVVLTAKMDGSSDNVEIFIDGSSVGKTTFHDVVPDPRNFALIQSIMIGGSDIGQGNGTELGVNEVVFWDEIIDPTNIKLASGSNGSLNGSSRSDFVDVENFDALHSTDPGVNSVVTGVSYYINGIQKTGTKDVTTIKTSENIVELSDRNFTVEEM